MSATLVLSTPRCTVNGDVIATSLALYDIKCAEAFVAANIHKSGVIVRDPHEREDLLSEGLTILLELASKYEPHREGYAKVGSFAGYAAKYLPGRMRDAYYANHREHTPRRDVAGRRVYEFGDKPMSLEHPDMPAVGTLLHFPSVLAEGHDYHPSAMIFAGPTASPEHQFRALQLRRELRFEPEPVVAAATCYQPPGLLRDALYGVAADNGGMIARGILRRTEAGLSPSEIAREMRIDLCHVRRTLNAVASAYHYHQTLEAA